MSNILFDTKFVKAYWVFLEIYLSDQGEAVAVLLERSTTNARGF